ncbi:MAG TPA: KH domain-containing protein [Acidimicrobiales bacterium]|nr:KH domain-containing protein [Acidimicrobiales bacterium]
MSDAEGPEDYEDDDLDDEDDELDGNRVPAAVSQAVLGYVAKAIVDEPEAVVIQTEEGRHGVTLRLHVAPEDMGKIIGRRGRVAQALRTLVRSAGSRDGVEVQLDIVD